MRQIVNRFIKKHSLLFPESIVVVGVSGGPDSLALLHFLKNYQKWMKLTVIAAHVDHMLRGEESAEDFDFVKTYCQYEEIIFEGSKINVQEYQQTNNLSVQVAARECRYRFFAEVMRKHQASILALAHHGDDQIETVIMRQVRGAQGLGLAGIPVKRPFNEGVIIRPFLCLSKEEIYTYCQNKKLSPRIDKSNFSSKYTRNRIRNEILPIFKKENPAVHVRFQQQSELMIDDELFLQKLAENELQNLIISKEINKVVLSIPNLINSPIPLQRRAFQLILNYLYIHNIPEITTIHIDQFLNFLKEAKPSGSLDFPNGLIIIKSYEQCILSFHQTPDLQHYEYYLPIPGIVTVKKGKIFGEVINALPKFPPQKNVVIFDLEKISLPLSVRNRQKGDFISQQGMKGTKKLKSLFIDEKIDRSARGEWPIVVDGNGEILWVPNLRRSNKAFPSHETKHFLVLTFQQST